MLHLVEAVAFLADVDGDPDRRDGLAGQKAATRASGRASRWIGALVLGMKRVLDEDISKRTEPNCWWRRPAVGCHSERRAVNAVEPVALERARQIQFIGRIGMTCLFDDASGST